MARQPLETLTEQMFYVLLALKEPRHGYAAMQYITELTCGRVRVGAGTLYMLLSRFDDDYYIDASEDEKGRKTYVLRKEGMELLLRECRRYELLRFDYDTVMNEEERV